MKNYSRYVVVFYVAKGSKKWKPGWHVEDLGRCSSDLKAIDCARRKYSCYDEIKIVELCRRIVFVKDTKDGKVVHRTRRRKKSELLKM